MWFYQMEPPAQQGFRCLAYDRQAHGRSSDPGRGHDYDTLADDLADVTEIFALEDVTLVAHPFASGEAIRYLTRYGGNRIARVVLVAPAAIPFLLKTDDNRIGVPGSVFEQAREAFLSDFAGWAEANTEPYFVPGTPRATVDWTIRTMTQTSLQAEGELPPGPGAHRLEAGVGPSRGTGADYPWGQRRLSATRCHGAARRGSNP